MAREQFHGNRRPAKLQVWRRLEPSRESVLVGGESGDEPFNEMAGTTITNLLVEVVDEAGEIVKIPSNTEIATSWSGGKNVWRSTGDLLQTFGGPIHLPTITLWLQGRSYTEEFDVRIKGLNCDGGQLETKFTINAIYG